jgi:hypothetical protein
MGAECLCEYAAMPRLIVFPLNKLKREDELNIYDAYSADLQTRQKLTLQVK